MHRLTSLCLLCALFNAAPASAMRAREYLDAGHRSAITLAGERSTLTLPMEQAAAVTAAAAEPGAPEQLPSPEQAHAVAVPAVTSPLPEPSGLSMLACGLMLLMLKLYHRDREKIAQDPEKVYTL